MPETLPGQIEFTIRFIHAQSHPARSVLRAIDLRRHLIALTFHDGHQPEAGAVGIRHGQAIERAADLIKKTTVLIRLQFVAERLREDGKRIHPVAAFGDAHIPNVRHGNVAGVAG